MRTPFKRRIFHVTGKARKRKDQWISYDMETMVQAAAMHFQVLGMMKIELYSPDTLAFVGAAPEGWDSIFGGFQGFVGQGVVRIDLDGPQLEANYLVQPSVISVLVVLGSMVLFAVLSGFRTGLVFTLNSLLASLAGLVGFGLLLYCSSYLFIGRGMKKELINAFQVAENIIESKTRNYDISLVEPGHMQLNSQNLARSAYYYRNEGMIEKSRAYFALLLKNFPFTEEATAAFYELRKHQEGREEQVHRCTEP